MAQHQCPGPYRKEADMPAEAKCPHCGAEMEFWTSDAQVTCPSCKKVMARNELE